MAKKILSPTRLSIATYQVGFGDCFLLTFHYPDLDRHVLVDFGSTALPKGAAKGRIKEIAEDIATRCQKGKLVAVVATHRHKDHISGFATTQRGAGPGDRIRALRPELVIQPWTEDPKARRNARKATRTLQRGKASLAATHLATLEQMSAVAEASLAAARRMRRALDFELADELAFIAGDNLANRSAIDNLASMSRRRAYVSFGSRSGLETLLPGVKVHVLGPPTREQTESIRKQRSKDPVEFWHFWTRQAAASRSFAATGKKLFPKHELKGNPVWARWFRQRLTDVHADGMLQIVRILDDAMNNTSVILLLEVGQHRLLFPGDAQIENWAYALSKPSVQKLLAGVNLYKVGHHGSLNATPKSSLWPLFKHRSKQKRARQRMTALLSTMAGKHGHVEKQTEVPRSKLVRALKTETNLFSTQKLEPNAEPHVTTLEVRAPKPPRRSA